MVRKIFLGILLTGFIGILIWGGVNRTLAKTNDSEGRNANNQSTEGIEAIDGNGVQQRGNRDQENHDDEDCDEEGHQGDSNGKSEIGLQSINSDTLENQAVSHGQVNGNRGGRGNGNGQGGGSDPLTATEIEALNLALDDEYHALAIYQTVNATFGEVEPFVEIAQSEQRHIDALVNQFIKHGLLVPENPWVGNVPIFESLQQACQAGAVAEIANADLYDQLFRMTDDPSLTRVFTNLSSASLNSHLPQFEACQ